MQRAQEMIANATSTLSSAITSVPEPTRVPCPVSLSIVPGGDLKSSESIPVLVSVQPPPGKKRTPADVICVVDISGSMGSPATVQNDEGKTESHGLNLLDIVKHAVRTVIHVLGPEDQFCLVAFDNVAEVPVDLTSMGDEASKTRAEAALDALQPRGGTNLWVGLERALDTLKRRNRRQASRLGSILLLTDGCPNQHPQGGEVKALQNYREANSDRLPGVVNTFGFGYNLDSKMLQSLALNGDGAYAFIPDSGLVGTCFVHALSNFLATGFRDAKLHLEGVNAEVLGLESTDAKEAAGDGLLAEHPRILTGNPGSVSLRLGALQHGQSRDLVVRVAAKAGPQPPQLKATLELTPVDQIDDDEHRGVPRVAVCEAEANLSGEEGPVASEAQAKVARQAGRLRAVQTMHKILKLKWPDSSDEAQAALDGLLSELRSSESESDEAMKALLEDLEGQVTEALSRPDWYAKWGRHYLPSLAGAHRLQLCNNFKDPGVQGYGGELFQNLRDEADELFVKLPPPKPSLRTSSSGGYGGGGASAAPIVSMAAYHNAGGGCFHGDNLVRMGDGSSLRVRELQPGDRVATTCRWRRRREALFPATTAEVECVVRIRTEAGAAQLTQLPNGGPLLTSWHPVRSSTSSNDGADSGAWQFPCAVEGSFTEKSHPCEAVYNLLLRPEEGAQSCVVVNGVECVALGHGLDEEVARHEFLGSRERIREGLSKMRGWEEGVVQLEPRWMLRHNKTGLICGFSPEAQLPLKKEADVEDAAAAA